MKAALLSRLPTGPNWSTLNVLSETTVALNSTGVLTPFATRPVSRPSFESR